MRLPQSGCPAAQIDVRGGSAARRACLQGESNLTSSSIGQTLPPTALRQDLPDHPPLLRLLRQRFPGPKHHPPRERLQRLAKGTPGRYASPAWMLGRIGAADDSASLCSTSGFGLNSQRGPWTSTGRLGSPNAEVRLPRGLSRPGEDRHQAHTLEVLVAPALVSNGSRLSSARNRKASTGPWFASRTAIPLARRTSSANASAMFQVLQGRDPHGFLSRGPRISSRISSTGRPRGSVAHTMSTGWLPEAPLRRRTPSSFSSNSTGVPGTSPSRFRTSIGTVICPLEETVLRMGKGYCALPDMAILADGRE